MLFAGDPPQTEIGEVNTINSFAAPRNAQGVSVNTTTPPVPTVNSINSWAEVRNAQVSQALGASRRWHARWRSAPTCGLAVCSVGRTLTPASAPLPSGTSGELESGYFRLRASGDREPDDRGRGARQCSQGCVSRSVCCVLFCVLIIPSGPSWKVKVGSQPRRSNDPIWCSCPTC